MDTNVEAVAEFFRLDVEIWPAQLRYASMRRFEPELRDGQQARTAPPPLHYGPNKMNRERRLAIKLLRERFHLKAPLEEAGGPVDTASGEAGNRGPQFLVG